MTWANPWPAITGGLLTVFGLVVIVETVIAWVRRSIEDSLSDE